MADKAASLDFLDSILATGVAESRLEALHAALTPLVGREEEIGLLLRRWRQAARAA